MPVPATSPTTRVRAIASHLAGPPQAKALTKRKRWEQLPLYDELPPYKNFPGCAWSVWGEGDELGTVNLLTPEVVRDAAKEIRYAPLSRRRRGGRSTLLTRVLLALKLCSPGHTVCLNW